MKTLEASQTPYGLRAVSAWTFTYTVSCSLHNESTSVPIPTVVELPIAALPLDSD